MKKAVSELPVPCTPECDSIAYPCRSPAVSCSHIVDCTQLHWTEEEYPKLSESGQPFGFGGDQQALITAGLRAPFTVATVPSSFSYHEFCHKTPYVVPTQMFIICELLMSRFMSDA